MLWREGHDRRVRLRTALARAAGVRCNGTPTYDAYRGINRNALLYFDSRCAQASIPSAEAVQAP